MNLKGTKKTDKYPRRCRHCGTEIETDAKGIKRHADSCEKNPVRRG